MFKKVRIAILLFILFLVGANAYLTQQRITDWDQFLSVVIYPINADKGEFTADYISSLTPDVFRPIERFMQAEAAGYNIPIEDPVSMDLAPEVNSLPPSPPFA